MGRDNLHFPDDDFLPFCKDFHSIVISMTEDVSSQKLKEKLKSCSEKCNIREHTLIASPLATHLLLDGSSEDLLSKERVKGDICLVMCGYKWTASLEHLVVLQDTDEKLDAIFSQCSTLMSDIICRQPDFLSNTPLEIAYRWILSCNSAINRKLIFNNWSFLIKCEQVEERRIFAHKKATPINDELIDNLQNNTLYYVQEGKGYETHPLFDMFFLDARRKKPTLVMIDVTGSSDIVEVEKKLKKLSDWIGEQKLEKYDLKGIVLATP